MTPPGLSVNAANWLKDGIRYDRKSGDAEYEHCQSNIPVGVTQHIIGFKENPEP